MKSRLRGWLAPLPRPLRRMLIIVVGSSVVLFGVLLLVLPRPGILVIIVGLAILGTEFAWAEALLAWHGGARRASSRSSAEESQRRGRDELLLPGHLGWGRRRPD